MKRGRERETLPIEKGARTKKWSPLLVNSVAVERTGGGFENEQEEG